MRIPMFCARDAPTVCTLIISRRFFLMCCRASGKCIWLKVVKARGVAAIIHRRAFCLLSDLARGRRQPPSACRAPRKRARASARP